MRTTNTSASGVHSRLGKSATRGTVPRGPLRHEAHQLPGATPTASLEYGRYQESSAPSAVRVDLPAPVDITIPWTANKTVIGFQVAGQLPTQDWTVDVTLKLSGKITYEY
jgi:hypothetical protein